MMLFQILKISQVCISCIPDLKTDESNEDHVLRELVGQNSKLIKYTNYLQAGFSKAIFESTIDSTQ